jgi:hypothetical protein
MKEMKLEILAKKSGNGNSVAATLAAGGHFQHSIILFLLFNFQQLFYCAHANEDRLTH